MKIRSHCPFNFALDHFGDKWSLLIIRDLMFNNKRHYNEFFNSEEGVSTSVLGDRLKMLESLKFISKSSDSVKKSRIKYSLTKKGISLLPLMIEMVVWSDLIDNDTEAGSDFVIHATKDRDNLISILQEKLEKEHLKI